MHIKNQPLFILTIVIKTIMQTPKQTLLLHE